MIDIRFGEKVMNDVCKIATISAAAVCFMICGCEKKQEAILRPPTPAVLTEAVSKTLPKYVSSLGTIAASESVNVVPQVSGQIVKINFNQGDFVKKGQVLAKIDSRPYEAAVRQAEGNLRQAKAQLKIDELEVERNRNLAKNNYVDKQTFDSYLAKVEMDKGNVESLQAVLDDAKIKLDWCDVKAPVDGKVGFYNITVGNVVQAGAGTPITTIEDVDNLYVDFVIASQDLNDVMNFMKSSGGKLKILVSYIEDDMSDKKSRLATADIVLNKIRYATGTAILRGSLENKDHLFWPNQPVKVVLYLETVKDAVLVPDVCVQTGTLGQYVYVARPVEGGVYRMEQVWVESGQLYEGGLRMISGDVKGGDLIAQRVLHLMLQAGPFVYRATDNGAIYGPDGKVISTPEGASDFIKKSSVLTEKLRAEYFAKQASASSGASKDGSNNM